MNPTRILIAEDEPQIRQYMLDCLADMPGTEIVLVPSGEMALAKLEREHWDVVISDQRMVKVDGVQVLKRARELHPLSQRAMLTGYADAGLAVEAKNDGAIHRFLTKPISPSKLVEAVAHLASTARERSLRAGAFGRAMGAVERQ